uniref:Histone-lysine N-methyltransferase SETMAR-like n=1 Tax=Geotrypetes seraphini TaxID=260995 RepID=A0A6P8PQ40_GEOSA|nr:histone-lysine N-methyltransferase SETMAR-like [Geotrypetes seraphini]
MDKIEYRAVIKFLHLQGKSPTEIKYELDTVYGDASPSFSKVKAWAAEFKRSSQASTVKEECSGCPKSATTNEMVDEVHRIVMVDCRLTLNEIAEAAGISSECVHTILHEYLGMRKLSARWVPRLLTMDQKRVRLDISKTCLERFKHNERDFLRRFVIVDETWVHHYTPETKQQSRQWTTRQEPTPKRKKMASSAGKMMATVFWDFLGIIFIDYLEKGKTINGEYYAGLLQRLRAEIKMKRPHLSKKTVLLHQDNAPAHTSTIVMVKLHELRFKLIPHPPYSPDLAPCDFFLFPNLKKWLSRKKFSSDSAVIDAINRYFSSLDVSYFTEGMKGLEKRWSKCIELKGDYVEK